MTPSELLEFFADARGLERARKRERIDRVIHLCGLPGVLDKPIRKLSRGYRQRVGMAHTLLHDPEVLIMDEPTAGLDPNQIKGVRETLRELGRTKTILLSTHILQEVGAVASRVIMIDAGRLVFDGTADELRARGSGSLDQAFYALTGAR
jgi:ABC-2 type transport system ATP-binding protein